MYDEIYIAVVAVDIVEKRVFLTRWVYLWLWRTMVCRIRDILVDGVLCDNQPNSAVQVPSKIENVAGSGDIVANDSVSP